MITTVGQLHKTAKEVSLWRVVRWGKRQDGGAPCGAAREESRYAVCWSRSSGRSRCLRNARERNPVEDRWADWS